MSTSTPASMTQTDKAAALRALHERGQPFVIANAWDAASARMLEAAGFQALATSSAAAEAGAVGGSIEDSTGEADGPALYDFERSVARVAAAVEAARQLPFHFTVTARAENFFQGVPDLDDTIRRLQAYERAGADVLFAPLLPDLDAVRRVCASVSKPVNFMNGVPGKSHSVAVLGEAGVRRISVATSLFRHAMKAARQAADEILAQGTFGYIDRG